MTHMLDIFRMESCGVFWLGSTVNLGGAKALLQELAARSSKEYLVLDLETGDKHVIQLGSMAERPDNHRTEAGTHE